MRITKEGQAAGEVLWGKLASEDTGALATEEVAGDPLQGGVFYDSRPPAGYVFAAGHFKIASPKSGEEVAAGIEKLAGFWQEAFSNVSATVKNTIRGGVPHTDTMKGVMDTVRTGAGGMRGHIPDMKAFRKAVDAIPVDRGSYSSKQLALGGALVAMPLAAGAAEAHHAYKQHQFAVVLDHLQKDPAFENVSDSAKVKEAYHLMMKYSPNIALDPVVSKSFVMLIVSHPDSANVETIGNLMEAEKKFKENNDFSGAFSDRVRRLMRHPLAEPFTGGGGGGGKKGK